MAIADIFKSWFKKESKKPAPAAKTQQAPAQARTNVASSGSTPAVVSTSAKTSAPPAEPVSTGNPLLDKVYHSPQLSISLIALAKIDDQEQLADIILKHNIAKIRQEAAARLNDAQLLQRTAEKIKHSDKGVYRLLRKKLASHAAGVKAANERRHLLEKICHDLEAHQRQSANPLFAAKVQSLHQHWQQATAAEPAPADLDQRYRQAADAIQSMIAQQQQQRLANEHALREQQQIVQQLQALTTTLLEQDDLPNPEDCRQTFNHLQDTWRQQMNASTDLASQFQQLSKQLNGLLDLAEKTFPQLDALQQLVGHAIAQPEDAHNTLSLKDLLKQLGARQNATLPVLTHARAVLAQAEQRLATAKAAAATSITPTPDADIPADFLDLVKQLEQALADGNSRHADKYLKAARQLAKQHHLHEPRLAQWAAELHKLKDWAGFAILPKKEALVAQMQALAAEHDADGLERLDQIKALQAEWQAVGMVNNDAEKALWRQFKELGQQAYQPCQRHFDAQKLVQEENARQRTALCDELQQYLDQMPSEINWSGHIAILKKAREDWQKFHPVEARTHKKLQARFNDILQQLEHKLQAEYSQQAARKQAIIDQAAALLTLDNVRDACQQAKELQQRWKESGSCGHAQDQALWEKFRQQCDAIFARRDQDKHNRQQQEQAAVELARTLLAELADVVAQTADESRQQQVDALSNRLLDLSLPRDMYQDVRQQLTGLQTQWQQQLASRQQQARAAELSDVTAAIRLCFNTENRVLAGLPVSEQDQAAWDQLTLPELLAPVLSKRWQNIPLMSSRSSHTGQFNATCLFLELLLDIASPEAEQQARTAKKMQVFQQQSYPKTLEEKRNITQHLLSQLAGFSGLTLVEQEDAVKRIDHILSAPELGHLL